jgi:hypothetical protein
MVPPFAGERADHVVGHVAGVAETARQDECEAMMGAVLVAMAA